MIKRAAIAENYYARRDQSTNFDGDTDKRNGYKKILDEYTELLKKFESKERGGDNFATLGNDWNPENSDDSSDEEST